MIVPLLGLSLMVQFPVMLDMMVLEMGHVVKTVIAMVVSFILCIVVSCSLVYTPLTLFNLLKLSTLYPDAGGTFCNEFYKACYCENAFTNAQAGDGDCCQDSVNCASGNCVQTGPGSYDKTCVLSASIDM